MSDEQKPIDPDFMIDGRLPVFKQREGESSHDFAGRLVGALDRTPPKRLSQLELLHEIGNVYPDARVISSLYGGIIALINFVGKLRFGRKLNLEVLEKSYDYTVTYEGNVLGLVKGDTGYEDTGIKLDQKTMDAMTFTPNEAGTLISAMGPDVLRILAQDFPQLHKKLFALATPQPR